MKLTNWSPHYEALESEEKLFGYRDGWRETEIRKQERRANNHTVALFVTRFFIGRKVN